MLKLSSFILFLKTIYLSFLLSTLAISTSHAEMSGLGDLAGGSYSSRAYGVSGDGLTFVGSGTSTGGTEAFKYVGSTMTGLGFLTGGNTSTAFGTDSDGSVIVGYGSSSNAQAEAFKYVGSTMTGLGFLTGGTSSVAYGVSSDGSVIVGYSGSTDGQQAFKYVGSTMTGLGDLPGGVFSSWARAASSDGSVIVGMGTSADGGRAIKHVDGTMTNLGVLAGHNYSEAMGISSDGLVIVGASIELGGVAEAFKYVGSTMTGLGFLTGGTYSLARGTSSDGSVIVGYGDTSSGASQAFKYVGSTMTGLGFLTGGTTSEALGVSSDGQVIVGLGSSTDGIQAFVYRNAMLNVANTTTALATTGSQLHSILNYKNNILSQSLNANCNVFGLSKVCARLSLRQDSDSTNNELSSNSAQSAFVLTGAYQVQPNLYLGGLIEQGDHELPSNYQDTRNDPTVGLFASYAGTYKGRQYTAKLSAAFNNEDYNITRDVLTDTEAGTGSSRIASEGMQLEVITMLPSFKGIVLTGVAKLNYKNSDRAGYVETSAVDFPVTYSSVEHNAVTSELNLYGEKKLANHWLTGGYIGLEHDLSNKISSYDATGSYINSVSLTPQILKTTRYEAGLYSIYAPQPNQHIKLSLSYRDAPFLSESLTSTAIEFVTAF
jgi:probable HAF family extracellular repeat protein